MRIGNVRVRRPPGNQVLLDVPPSSTVGFAVFTVAVQPQYGNPDGAVVEQLDGGIEEGPIPGRIAIGSQTHDLVFVRIEVKAKMKRDDRIQDADGVLRGDLLQLFQLVVMSMIDRGAV